MKLGNYHCSSIFIKNLPICQSGWEFSDFPDAGFGQFFGLWNPVLCLLKEKKINDFWWFLQLSATAHQRLRILLSLGLLQECGLYLKRGWIL